ncbi:hypothetical protein V7S43_014079 [Phytophthora oleae]|uniref:Uncharacterized protein n=1 Tax=Phytophthora oleae TaxID=2107226 RepID=A0ABD3F469_9STRA
MTSIASSSSGIIKIDLRAIEESACPGSGNSVDDSLGTNENGDIYESSSVGSGYVSFSDLDDSTSVYIEGSFDAEVQIPSTASSNGGSKSNSSGEIDGTTSASDISTIKDTGSSESTRGFWSGSGSSPTDTKPPDGDEQKISLPIPSSPSGPGVTSTSREPFPSSPSSSSPVPGYVATSGTSWSISPMWDPSSSGSSTSISPPIPTSPANEGSTYPVGTVAAPTGNPEDNVNSSSDVSSDTSTTGNRDMPRTPTPSAIQPSSGSADKGSRSGNLSATSFVTKSPFFYASIILAIIGLVGVVVGYRAKQKRSHHDEMRAFRMSMRQSTRTATPANNSSSGPTSPRNLHSQTRFDTHSIVIL